MIEDTVSFKVDGEQSLQFRQPFTENFNIDQRFSAGNAYGMMDSGPTSQPEVEGINHFFKGNRVLFGIKITPSGSDFQQSRSRKVAMPGVTVGTGKIAAMKAEKRLAKPDQQPFPLD